MSDMDKVIQEMRGYLDENRDRYAEAQDKLSDPSWVRSNFEAIKSMLSDVMQYNPIKVVDSGTTAALIIGRTQIRVAGLYADIEFMAQFEEEQKRFEEAVQQIEASESEDQPK